MKLRLTLKFDAEYVERYKSWEHGTRFGFKEGQKDYAMLTDKEGRHFFMCHSRNDGAVLYKGSLCRREALFSAFKPVWEKHGINHVYLICCFSGVEKNFVSDDFSVVNVFPTTEEIGSAEVFFEDEDGSREIDFFTEVSEDRLSELPEELDFCRLK